MLEQASKCCLKYFAKCLVNLVQEQVLKRRWFKNPEQPRNQDDRVFAAANCLPTRCLVDSKRVLVWYRFYFLRFLLICHRESLNLTHTLKWFLFGKYCRTPSQNSSGNRMFRVFSSQTEKTFFHRFFPWFLGQRLWVFLSRFSADFFGLRRLFFWLWETWGGLQVYF